MILNLKWMLMSWTSSLSCKGEKAFIVFFFFEKEAGNIKKDSWMETEYAIFFHLARRCPWAVPGWPKFSPVSPSPPYLAILPPPSILSGKLPSKLNSTFTNKYNENTKRKEKSKPAQWWIKLVRSSSSYLCFVVHANISCRCGAYGPRIWIPVLGTDYCWFMSLK